MCLGLPQVKFTILIIVVLDPFCRIRFSCVVDACHGCSQFTSRGVTDKHLELQLQEKKGYVKL